MDNIFFVQVRRHDVVYDIEQPTLGNDSLRTQVSRRLHEDKRKVDLVRSLIVLPAHDEVDKVLVPHHVPCNRAHIRIHQVNPLVLLYPLERFFH